MIVRVGVRRVQVLSLGDQIIHRSVVQQQFRHNDVMAGVATAGPRRKAAPSGLPVTKADGVAQCEAEEAMVFVADDKADVRDFVPCYGITVEAGNPLSVHAQGNGVAQGDAAKEQGKTGEH